MVSSPSDALSPSASWQMLWASSCVTTFASAPSAAFFSVLCAFSAIPRASGSEIFSVALCTNGS
eukprot:CAMPEP_0168417934 /NCGR_PEP_ID=MMETSP0228-20121227/31507_1 /TAXON_ID=133427 /ORGANISM="Protoceratium reticulatum, Strain CCCM 535 (=CCMP 1889)" /LENGTH=63 /DNA_ID=CAMNT_0008431797 /DNA_START=43 /DNA_END=230 /DNA_ORIENTATION=-